MSSSDARYAYDFGQQELSEAIDYTDRLTTGFGLNYKFNKELSGIVEWNRIWTLPFNSLYNPNELILALRYMFRDKFSGFLFGNIGDIAENTDSNDYRFGFGIKFSPSEEKPTLLR
jgi:hypothetical protein